MTIGFFALKIAISTTLNNEGFTLPGSQESVPNTTNVAPESVPPIGLDPDTTVSPLAPTVPIMIVPVNAAENNTVSSSPPAAEMISPIPVIDAAEPVVIVTEPSATLLAVPESKSEKALAPVPLIVEVNAHLSAQVKQVPVVTEPAVELETTVPAATAKPEPSPTAPEPTAEPKATPAAAAEPLPPTREGAPAQEGKTTAPEPEQTAAPLQVAEPPSVVEIISSVGVPEPELAPVPGVKVPPTEASAGAIQVPKAQDEPLIDFVPIPVVEEAKCLESLLVIDQPLPSGKPAHTSQGLVLEPAVESTPVVTENNDVLPVDEIKTVPASEVKREVAKPSISEDEVVGPPLATNALLAAEPSPVVEEVLSAKDSGQPNDRTTEPGPGNQISPNEHGTLSTTTSTLGAPVEKFPSSSASQNVSPTNSPSSSKFNSRRKKTSSFFGKLKNIFDHDKVKEKK